MNIFVFKIFLLQYIVTHLLFQNVQANYTSRIPSTAYTCRNLSPRSCNNTKYRTIDGSCNNLQKPEWGAVGTPFRRLIPNKYGDGLSSFPLSETGKALPLAREISLSLFPDKPIFDKDYSLLLMQWGQIITHDIAFSQPLNRTENKPTTCCRNGTLANETTNAVCAPLLVPQNDPAHRGDKCMNFRFVRTATSKDVGCTPADVPAEQLTGTSSFMDLSLMYGTTSDRAAELRDGKGGRLKTVERVNEQWPPNNPNGGCPNYAITQICYLSGDFRVNQNPHLAMLTLILLREHNRIADYLAYLNPHWDDETLYEEARRILIAIVQRINYYEYLHNLLGYENMVKGKLIYPDAKGYVNDYSSYANPSVFNELTTAAFRHFHSSIVEELKLMNDNRKSNGSIRLSDWFTKPEILDSTLNFMAIGITGQEMSASDQYWTEGVTTFLFKDNNNIGQDLRAIDIQRGRDHGLGSYSAARAACGLSVPKTFDDMKDYISSKNVEKLKKLYKSPNDVELVVAGSLEQKVPGTQAGSTFLSILIKQFLNSRIGDRFFFENGADSTTAFTIDQLETIRKGSSVARLICDNVNGVTQMQPEAFKMVSSSNKLVPCEELPSVNLDLWKDSSNTYDEKTGILDVFKPLFNMFADIW